MPRVEFTPNVQRHIECQSIQVAGTTVLEALDLAFQSNPDVRGYFLDDQGAVRKHVVIFLDGSPIKDRQQLSDEVAADSEIYMMQALSGG